ncbi:MAG: hypothetical protein KatS3mg123_0715 [Burkholderiales bacterium]|nr:MAG: hypothetical protein KatS3mg123_0715 [Burkholderiales bacterium]
MATSRPLLRTKLLQWLLVPLVALLALDAFVSYFAAVRFSQRAYDRSLADIARELALHVQEREGQVVFDLPQPAQRVLLTDPSDTLYFRVVAADGRILAGDEQLGRLSASPAREREQPFFDAMIDGVPVRVAMRGGATARRLDTPCHNRRGGDARTSAVSSLAKSYSRCWRLSFY